MNTPDSTTILGNQRLTQTQKNANDKEWYKNEIRRISSRSFNTLTGYGNVNEYVRKKVNYDLFNNIIDDKDFEYVCKPYGAQQGEMPAKMVNRDICSNRIKLLIGMEMQRPFSWKVIAVNEEATTRKEQEQSKLLHEFVVSEIMTPIQQEIEIKYREQTNGKLSQEDKQKLQQQIQQEISSKTPPEVLRYMKREHQDPAEVLSNQILEYLIQKENIPFKFNTGFKHAMLTGEEFYWVGILNNHPVLRVINPLYFDYERTHENFFVEEGSWAVYDLRLSISQTIQLFGEELGDETVEKLYEDYPYGGGPNIITFNDFSTNFKEDSYTIRVLHCEWKSERKIQFLTYLSKETGKEEEMLVPEEYKLNKAAGDIKLKTEWIPELHEGYQIAGEYYAYCRPVPGQHRDLDNLYNCKLRYHGTMYDSLNSSVTSPMDRVKPYQYFHNIIMYRMEMLMASDKGKWLLMNINAIPKSAGIDIKKWMYYTDALKIGWVNPTEEGNKGGTTNIGEMAKEIDMSLISDIQKYIGLADKMDSMAGKSLGITDQMMGQLGASDAVTNTKQSIMQSSYVLEPYYDLHNEVKKNVLQSLIETAKVAYTINPPESLSYVLDDMSLAQIKLNKDNLDLLENSTYGIFVSNSSQAFEAKKLIENLAHAAIQNQSIELSDVIKVVRVNNVQEAEEMLEASEERKRNHDKEVQNEGLSIQAQEAEKQRLFTRELWAEQEKQIVLKEQERRKTVLQSDTIKATGFNEDKDANDNGQPDVLELEEHFLNTRIKEGELSLKNQMFQHKQEDDKKKNELTEQKLKIDKQKAMKTTKT